MTSKEQHIVIVHFTTDKENQNRAIQEVGDYIESFLSCQSGFIASRLHVDTDGYGLVHYAEWSSESDFLTAAEKARSHPDLPKLMVYKPRASGYQVLRKFPSA
jgi:hypothetical protein